MKKYKIFLLLLCLMFILSGCKAKEKQTEETTEEPLKIESEEEEEVPEEEESEEQAQEPEEPQTNGKLIVIDPGHSGVVAQGTEPVGPGAS